MLIRCIYIQVTLDLYPKIQNHKIIRVVEQTRKHFIFVAVLRIFIFRVNSYKNETQFKWSGAWIDRTIKSHVLTRQSELCSQVGKTSHLEAILTGFVSLSLILFLGSSFA